LGDEVRFAILRYEQRLALDEANKVGFRKGREF
jgi:hypothetical protein